MPAWLIGLALSLIILLALVAGYYCGRLWLLRRRQKAQREELGQAEQLAVQRHVQSIRIIASSCVNGQLEMPEACIRVSGLLDMLGVQEEQRSPYVALDKMRSSISHIPIKEQWQALSRREREAYRQQIDKSVSQFEDFVNPAMTQLQEFVWPIETERDKSD